MTISLTYEEKIAILDLGDDENRFSPSFLDDIDARLDEIVAGGAHGLVTTATGKFYTNGLDLDWLAAHSEQTRWYVGRVQGLLARMLTLPIPTAAAVVGHAFGAGAMLAVAHDFRVMRADRGFWCLPEADIKIPFSAGMSALIQARLNPQTAHEAMTTGRRYGGHDALAAAIVDRTADEHEVRQAAIEIAGPQAAKADRVLGTIKSRMYASVLDALREKDIPLG